MLRFLLLVLIGVAVVGAVAERRLVAQDHDHAHAEDGHTHDLDHAHAEEGHMHDFDESMPPRQSMLTWTFRSLGWRYTLALPLAGMFSFVAALIIVMRGGPHAGAALLLVVPVPLLVGALGFFDGMIQSFTMLAVSASPKPSELAEGFSTSLVTPVVGMLLMAPAYLVAMGGLMIRTFAEPRPPRIS